MIGVSTMNPFRFLTRVFIDVFGITHPTPKQEQRATWFISAMLGLIVVGLLLFFLALHSFTPR